MVSFYAIFLNEVKHTHTHLTFFKVDKSLRPRMKFTVGYTQECLLAVLYYIEMYLVYVQHESWCMTASSHYKVSKHCCAIKRKALSAWH